MTLLDNNQYKEILRNAIARFDRWDIFSGKSFFITGASGMVGSFFIDLLMTVNQEILAKINVKLQLCAEI